VEGAPRPRPHSKILGTSPLSMLVCAPDATWNSLSDSLVTNIFSALRSLSDATLYKPTLYILLSYSTERHQLVLTASYVNCGFSGMPRLTSTRVCTNSDITVAMYTLSGSIFSPPHSLRISSTSLYTQYTAGDRCWQMDLQQLWWQVSDSCRSEAVEQSSSWTATSWH